MGFEREILSSLEKAHRDIDIKLENLRPQQQIHFDEDKYALKSDLSDIVNTMMAAQKHLEEV